MKLFLPEEATTTLSNNEMLFHYIKILKSLLDKTTAEYFNLHPTFMTEALWQRPNKAPITFVTIYKDDSLTLEIVILKPNMKIPLHNHPQMYGLIKVIGGKLKVTSYSINTEKTQQVDSKEFPGPKSKFLTAEKSSEKIFDVRSECSVLEPEMGNIHELESVEGPTAFINFLTPSYNNEVRKGSYYKVLKEVAPKVFRLQEIDAPRGCQADSFPYTGPKLL